MAQYRIIYGFVHRSLLLRLLYFLSNSFGRTIGRYIHIILNKTQNGFSVPILNDNIFKHLS